MADREKVTLTSDDIAVVKVSDLVSDPFAEFEGHKPLKGAEHLGRAIVDAKGFPSGSPANYEAIRVKTHEEEARLALLEAGPTEANIAAAAAAAIESAAVTTE
jgi:hypothetical protein